MRFEIGPGGFGVILLGLVGLSGAVFGLGLIAGHELAGPEPGAQQVAAAYPLPAPPTSGSASPAMSESNPASAKGSAVEDGGPGATTASGKKAPSINPPSYPSVGSARMPKAPSSSLASGAGAAARKTAGSRTAVAAKASRASASAESSAEDLSPGAPVAPPSAVGSASSESADTSTDDSGDDEAADTRPAPAAKRVASTNPAASNPESTNPSAANSHQPYSIQIDAVMDWQGAQQMSRKLRSKGFQPFVVPTQLGGKTWYRLRVGHYATPEQAQEAEAKLHQQFNDTPSSH